MANDEWRTPEWVWKPYAPFDLDAAATAENALAPKFITKEMDALTLDWREICPAPARVWCNPPYSQAAGPLFEWITVCQGWSRFYRVVMLLPADTSTKWFHYLLQEKNMGTNVNIKFLERRVRHLDPLTGKPGGSPKFGSIIVEFLP